MQVGYTHANWIYAGKIQKNIISYDFTSSYPYVMLSEKYPMSEFKKCNIKSHLQLLDNLAYLIHVKLFNVSCKYFNNFISQSKCIKIKKGRYDNGRIISAEEIEIILTDIDFKFLLKTYDFEYTFIECYYSIKNYLPVELINFILDKYIKKTELKNVIGYETEYMLQKNLFNSIYGMCVTNNIRNDVLFDNKEWKDKILTNEEIIYLLKEEKEKAFLSFSWRCFCNSLCKKKFARMFISVR